ncbi:MAG: oligosaccharide repeat unit polymerase [Chloroflexi bacterium]|nr:oligosaccharide repeat unit polymerase [Chloroflexota bacterium]
MIVLDYWTIFFLDLTVLLGCLVAMLRFGRLTALHPASLYFFFHGYTFTFRLFQLANGAPTLFEAWALQFSPITPAEIQRASFVSLVALIVMTLVWLFLSRRRQEIPVSNLNSHNFRPFSERLMWMILVFTLPVGLIAFIVLRGPIFSGDPSASLSVWATSSYLISMYQWFGISLLALIYYYGFRPLLIIPLIIYLILGLLTFPFRMMVIVPGLFVVFVYLRRKEVRWPSWRLALPLSLMILLFVSGKELGPILRQGDLEGAWNLLTGRITQMRVGTHGDAMFMDQMAVALSQIDERGQLYYGRTYLNLLLLPIPRALWPEKPGLADWQKEIQTARRPTGDMGAIVTALGEAYANFGYAGILLYSVFIGWLLNTLYNNMFQAPYYSVVNFWSLCVYALLIQVFRDGLVSFFTFQVTTLMPLTMITILHLIVLRSRRSIRGNVKSWATIFDRPNTYIDEEGHTRHRIASAFASLRTR